MTNVFGPHITLDFSSCDRTVLENYQLIFDILFNLPDKIGMTKITQPYVFPYSGLVPDDNGITGVVIIAESHLSIHTFPEKGWVFIDIFSCKPFETDYVINYLTEKFNPGKSEINIIERGLGFPR
jgi:S-adenosylmethionine decarboxylase